MDCKDLQWIQGFPVNFYRFGNSWIDRFRLVHRTSNLYPFYFSDSWFLPRMRMVSPNRHCIMKAQWYLFFYSKNINCLALRNLQNASHKIKIEITGTRELVRYLILLTKEQRETARITSAETHLLCLW
jgi:hypothetical protein